ncbi:MAG: hypothetical protein ACM3U2_13450 [Deltaproteobacteria bacterium]
MSPSRRLTEIHSEVTDVRVPEFHKGDDGLAPEERLKEAFKRELEERVGMAGGTENAGL